MKHIAPMLAVLLLAALATSSARAKLPPLSPDAQVKADEAKAKAAWTDKVAAYQLCKSMDRVAEAYHKTARAENRDKAAAPTPPCTDPGPFVAAAPAAQKPLEASGAHSPPATATSPPSVSTATQAQTQGTTK